MLERPTQAVILAGGRGTRLRPFTDHNPKPMYPFSGRPFLEYLLTLLHGQGFDKVLLLLGYLPEKIMDYFGDGQPLGLHIEYSLAPVEAETGERLKVASPKLEPSFLLLYCDNYWPLNMGVLWDWYKKENTPAMFTVYRNRDGYTRDNIKVDEFGYVVTYDRSRRSKGLSGVDIGYALLDKSVIDLIPEGNVSFEATVYPRLAERRQLKAFLTDHRYYSVSSQDRLPLTEAFLSGQKAVILDRDGVLNKKPPRAQYVKRWQDFEWLPGAIESLYLLKQSGYKILLVSNQAGIARGEMTDEDLHRIHRQMKNELQTHDVSIEGIYYCPHGWDEGCWCRKPRPGMLFQAQREYHLDLTKTFFIGDDERDVEAGQAAGCPTFLVTPEYSLLQCIKDHIPLEKRGEA